MKSIFLLLLIFLYTCKCSRETISAYFVCCFSPRNQRGRIYIFVGNSGGSPVAPPTHSGPIERDKEWGRSSGWMWLSGVATMCSWRPHPAPGRPKDWRSRSQWLSPLRQKQGPKEERWKRTGSGMRCYYLRKLGLRNVSGHTQVPTICQ